MFEFQSQSLALEDSTLDSENNSLKQTSEARQRSTEWDDTGHDSDGLGVRQIAVIPLDH